MKYKESEFNILFNIKNNEYLFFNTFSGAILKIDCEEYREFLNLIQNNKENKKMFDVYYKNGYIVNENKDEKSILQFMRMKNALQTKSMFFRILPTTDCNARCFYCYEHNVENVDMKESDIDKTVDFINKCLKKDTKKIGIQWYGGEPLLKFDLISKMTVKFKELFDSKKIEYTFSMISNGFLLDKISPQLLKDKLELKNIQISLDGYEEEYLKRKAYIDSSENAFDSIIKNIDILASAGIKVDVRLNCDGLNYDSMMKLIPHLGNHLKNKKNINVYAYPLYGTYVKESRNRPNEIDKEMLLNIIDALIKNKLFRIPSFKVKTNSCGATNYNSFDILPDGNLLKCMMNTDDIVGNISEGIDYNKEYFKWCSFELPKACINCKYLPLCEGGCKAGHLRYTKVKCFMYKDLMKEMLIYYINQQ